MEKNIRKFDVAVVGGGPAGMMAAGRAAELGCKVVLIEKNKNLGKKLLLTGKGRCNITQAQFSDQEFIKKIGRGGKFLFSALNFFGPREAIDFFEKRGLPTKVERGGRVFPVSEKSQDVLDVLKNYLEKNKVEIISGEAVLDFRIENEKIKSLKFPNGEIIAENFILCTGGKVYPLTGSTGDGYLWAKKFGHQIKKISPALVPVKIKEDYVKNLQGLSLRNVKINIFQNNKKQDSKFGEMIFTHFGISGPIVLDASKKIGELLDAGEVRIEIDLKPALTLEELDLRLRRDFEKNRKKSFKNYLSDLIPQKMIETFVLFSEIDPQKKLHFITKEERKKIVKILKSTNLTVEKLMGYDQAIITGGGIDISEIDSKTMRSKIIDNLFFAGEILDLDGPTGGYNLQICWSTGYAAGENAGRVES